MNHLQPPVPLQYAEWLTYDRVYLLQQLQLHVGVLFKEQQHEEEADR